MTATKNLGPGELRAMLRAAAVERADDVPAVQRRADDLFDLGRDVEDADGPLLLERGVKPAPSALARLDPRILALEAVYRDLWFEQWEQALARHDAEHQAGPEAGAGQEPSMFFFDESEQTSAAHLAYLDAVDAWVWDQD